MLEPQASREYLVLWKACYFLQTNKYTIVARLPLSCLHVFAMNCCCEWFFLVFCFVLVKQIISCHRELFNLDSWNNLSINLMRNEFAMLSSGRSLRATVVCLYNNIDCTNNHMIRFWSIFWSQIKHFVCDDDCQPWKWGLGDPSFHHWKLQHHVTGDKVSWVCLHVGACPIIPFICEDFMGVLKLLIIIVHGAKA